MQTGLVVCCHLTGAPPRALRIVPNPAQRRQYRPAHGVQSRPVSEQTWLAQLDTQRRRHRPVRRRRNFGDAAALYHALLPD